MAHWNPSVRRAAAVAAAAQTFLFTLNKKQQNSKWKNVRPREGPEQREGPGQREGPSNGKDPGTENGKKPRKGWTRGSGKIGRPR
jgi:hypothetical protein